ncbi:MAG: CcdB family protein [Xanthobacteraceae bacterium]
MLKQRAPKKRAVNLFVDAELLEEARRQGREFWLATHELFAVEQPVLQNKIATLSDERYTITAAIDFLFTGV